MISGWKKGWIGIDFGTHAVKLAQVERFGAELRLVRARIIARSEADAASGRDPAAWWDQLCATADLREGFVGRQAACVLPMAKAELRALHVPQCGEAEQRAIIANELATVGAGSGRSFDFWDSRPPAESGSQLENVSVLSVAEDEALTLAASLSRTGIVCHTLDALPLALARAVRMVSSGSPGPVAAIDWGVQCALFSIICDGRPVFTRHLRDCDFASLARSVGKAMDLPAEDVQQLLSDYGLCDPGREEPALGDVQDIVAEVAGEALNRIVEQLNKTLSYAELHRSKVIPGRIYLFGAGAALRNIGPYLSSKIGLPTQPWTLPAAASAAGTATPWELLGPAVALSSLAWMS